MPVFQVYLNGKKVSTAGVGEAGVVGAHVYWVRRKGEHTRAKTPDSVEEGLRLHVGGLITPSGEDVRWIDQKLKIGDEIRVVIVEDAQWTGHALASGRTPGTTHADKRNK